jgi:aspartyl-tRNA(Asn)/glutamyl-tRNA(Gln) amidotransferase subunit C
MELDKQVIKTLTQLSRIECTESEQEAILKDLEKVLKYVEQLQEIDTEKVPPCNHVLEGMANVMREDAAGEAMSRETFLSNVPSKTGGLVRIPSIFKS